jgi:hypothetical protein
VSPQLTFDGREVDVRTPRALTDRQRELLRFIRERGVVRPIEVGKLMHAGRPTRCYRCEHFVDCPYVSSDGCDALRRLERRGLVARRARGQWVAVISGEGWS